MTLPMTLGHFANMLFNMVDTLYISHLGQSELAAMAFTFPMVFFVIGTAMGMGMGVSAVASRALGEGNHERVSRLTLDSILLTALLVVGLICLGLIFMNPIFRRMGATPEQLPLIRQYMVPWFFGSFFFVIPMIGNSVIRATGDTLRPSMIMLLAGFVNVILDPLLIFGIGPFPRLELAGAAIATGCSYLAVAIASMCMLRFRFRMLHFRFEGWHATLQSWKDVLEIAIPAMGANQMIPVANGVLTGIVAKHGEAATAAWSVVTRLEALMMSPCFMLSNVMAPFVGQNFGAGNWDRISEALRFSAKFCFSLCLAIWITVALAGPWIGARFSDHPETLHWIVTYLWIVPFSYGAFGLMLQFTAAFNARRHPVKSTLVFLCRFFLLLIPLAWWGQHVDGLRGMFTGMAAGNFLAAPLAALWWHHTRKQEQAILPRKPNAAH